MLPITDEQAKLLQESVKALSGVGSYLADILGDLPKDLVGLLGGDLVKARRIEKATILWEKTQERLRDWRVHEPDPPSLKYAIPILEAAVDEENEGLQNLWARLLATAMDPARRDQMRQAFVETVKQMDPMDALVLGTMPRAREAAVWDDAVGPLSTIFVCEQDEVRVSFEHLAKLNCINFVDDLGARVRPYLTPFGKLLTNVVSGPPEGSPQGA
jgi:hypothetical protein